MAKQKLIKNSKGQYGILDLDSQMVTPVDMNTHRLLENKEGKLGLLNVSEQMVTPLDETELPRQEINSLLNFTLKKKDDTELLSQTDSLGLKSDELTFADKAEAVSKAFPKGVAGFGAVAGVAAFAGGLWDATVSSLSGIATLGLISGRVDQTPMGMGGLAQAALPEKEKKQLENIRKAEDSPEVKKIKTDVAFKAADIINKAKFDLAEGTEPDLFTLPNWSTKDAIALGGLAGNAVFHMATSVIPFGSALSFTSNFADRLDNARQIGKSAEDAIGESIFGAAVETGIERSLGIEPKIAKMFGKEFSKEALKELTKKELSAEAFQEIAKKVGSAISWNNVKKGLLYGFVPEFIEEGVQTYIDDAEQDFFDYMEKKSFDGSNRFNDTIALYDPRNEKGFLDENNQLRLPTWESNKSAINAAFFGGLIGQMGGMFVNSSSFNPSAYASLKKGYDSRGQEGLDTAEATLINAINQSVSDGKLTQEEADNAVNNMNIMKNDIQQYEQNSDLNSYVRYQTYNLTYNIMPKLSDSMATEFSKAVTPLKSATKAQIENDFKTKSFVELEFDSSENVPLAYKDYITKEGEKFVARIPQSVMQAEVSNKQAIEDNKQKFALAVESLSDINNRREITIEDVSRISETFGNAFETPAKKMQFIKLFNMNRGKVNSIINAINYTKNTVNNIVQTQEVDSSFNENIQHILTKYSGNTVFYDGKPYRVENTLNNGLELKLDGIDTPVKSNEVFTAGQQMVADKQDEVINKLKESVKSQKKKLTSIKNPTIETTIENELNNEVLTAAMAVDEKSTFIYNKKQGQLYSRPDGTIVFEDNNSVTELGNMSEIGSTPISELGLTPQDIVFKSDGSIKIGNQLYTNESTNPLDSISYDNNGNAVSVKLKDESGKTKVVRGERAKLIDYNYKLNQLQNEFTAAELARATNQAAELSRVNESTRETIARTEDKPVKSAPSPEERKRGESERKSRAKKSRAKSRLSKEGKANFNEAEKAINSALTALEGTGIKYNILDKESFETRFGETTQGSFIAEDGVIYLNKDYLYSGWGSTVVFHEGIHPVINIIFNTDKKLYKSLVDGMLKEAKNNPDIKKTIQQVLNSGAYKGEFEQNMESIVEVIARMASGKIPPTKVSKPFLQKVVDFVNKLASVLGIKARIKDINTDIYAFQRIASQIATALKEGTRVEEIVGEENIGEFNLENYNSFQSRAIDSDVVEFIAQEMNAMGGININLDIAEEISATGKLDLKAMESNKGIVSKPKVVEISDFTNRPIGLTISDELTVGSVTNPVTGEQIDRLFGGLFFPYTEGNLDSGWAYTSEDVALNTLKAAKEIYNKNPDLYPDNIVPFAVVKMGSAAMVSNEAIGRQLIQNLKKAGIPEKNKKEALKTLIPFLQDKLKKATDIVNSKGKDATPSEKVAQKAYASSLKLAKEVKSFDELIDRTEELNISERPFLVQSVTVGDSKIAPKSHSALNINTNPVSYKLFEGLDKQEIRRVSMGWMVQNLKEKAISNVPDKHIIGFIGIDISADAPIASSHPNYPYALKGKGLGVVKNTMHLAKVMPSLYSNFIEKMIAQEEKGMPAKGEKALPTAKTMISRAMPPSLNNVLLRGKTLVQKELDYNRLLGYLQLAFPSVNFFVNEETWNTVLSDPNSKQYSKKGDVVYAITSNGNIYLNPSLDALNHPIHETAHIWLDNIEITNQYLFDKGAGLVEGTTELSDAIKEYGDSIQARKEALAKLIENRGETIVEAGKKAAFKEWIMNVFRYVTSKFKSLSGLNKKQIDALTLDNFIDGAVKDILGGRTVTQSTKRVQKSVIEREYTYEQTLKDAGLTQQEVEKWKDENRVSQKQIRVPQVQEAAVKLFEGDITLEDYVRIVRQHQPIRAMLEVPKIPTFKEIISSLRSDKFKKGIFGVNLSLEDGTRVASRLDIPAYESFDTWVVTVHDSVKEGNPLGYGKTALLKNIEFRTSAKIGLKIAMDGEKNTIARIHGDWVNHNSEQLRERAIQLMNDPEWVQVGMNPFRHSFFYDKANGEAVIRAEEVIQIGALVLAKNVVRAPRGSQEFIDAFSTKNKKGDVIQFSSINRELNSDGFKNTPEQQFDNIDDNVSFVLNNLQDLSREEIQDVLMSTGLTRDEAEMVYGKATSQTYFFPEQLSSIDRESPENTPLSSVTEDKNYREREKAKVDAINERRLKADETFVERVFDKQFGLKKVLKSYSSFDNVAVANLTTMKGFQFAADLELSRIIKGIFDGLSADGIDKVGYVTFLMRAVTLGNIADRKYRKQVETETAKLRNKLAQKGKEITQEQIEAIERKARKDNPPPSSGKTVIDGKEVELTPAKAQELLDKAREQQDAIEKGSWDKFIEKRITPYEQVGKDLIKQIFDAGLITKRVYDEYKDDFYQFRKTYMADLDAANRQYFTPVSYRYYNDTKSWGTLRQEGSENIFQQDAIELLATGFINAKRAINMNNLKRSIHNLAIKSIEVNGEFVDEQSIRDKDGNIVESIKPVKYLRNVEGNIRKGDKGYMFSEVAEDGYEIVKFKDRGEEKAFQIETKLFNQLLNINDVFQSGKTIYNVTNWLNRLKTASATRYNPTFFITNLFYDTTQQVMFTDEWTRQEGKATSVVASLARSLWHANKMAVRLMKRDPQTLALLDEATREGLMFNLYSASAETVSKEDAIRDLNPEAEKLPISQKVKRFAQKKLGYLNERYEIGMRLAYYEKAKQNLEAEYKDRYGITDLSDDNMAEIKKIAAYKARAYTDFAQSGSIVPQLNVPYLNAGIQAFGTGLQYSVNNKAEFARKVAELYLFDVAMTVGFMLAAGADYDDYNEYRKQNSIQLFLGDRTFDYRINPSLTFVHSAARRTAEAIVYNLIRKEDNPYIKKSGKEIATDALNSIMDSTPVGVHLDFSSWGNFALGLSKPLTKHQLVNLSLTTMGNYNAFRGIEVVPSYEQQYANWSQGRYNKSVQYVFKALGETMDVSPAKLQAGFESIFAGESSTVIGVGYAIANSIASTVSPAEGKVLGEDGIKNLIVNDWMGLKTVAKRIGSKPVEGYAASQEARRIFEEGNELSREYRAIEREYTQMLKDKLENDPTGYNSYVNDILSRSDVKSDGALQERIYTVSQNILENKTAQELIGSDYLELVSGLYFISGAKNKALVLKSLEEESNVSPSEIATRLNIFGLPDSEVQQMMVEYNKLK